MKRFYGPKVIMGDRDLNRYDRNKTAISYEEQVALKNSRVCVVGCGGLGGYVVEMLGRIGVGTITAVDGDVFDETNLNRQILSDINVIGQKKALIARDRMQNVNPDVSIYPVTEFLTEKNAADILKEHDIAVDALDNVSARFILRDASKNIGIPFVHGAISGWYGQVSTIFPEDRTLESIYRSSDSEGGAKTMGNPSFSPGIVASIQSAEVIKFLLNKGTLLRKKLLFINLLDHEYEVLNL